LSALPTSYAMPCARQKSSSVSASFPPRPGESVISSFKRPCAGWRSDDASYVTAFIGAGLAIGAVEATLEFADCGLHVEEGAPVGSRRARVTGNFSGGGGGDTSASPGSTPVRMAFMCRVGSRPPSGAQIGSVAIRKQRDPSHVGQNREPRHVSGVHRGPQWTRPALQKQVQRIRQPFCESEGPM
jgi:hypothetical protein